MSRFDEEMGPPKKTCIRCGDVFTMTGTAQKYCGSLKEKFGCAYESNLENKRNKYQKHPKTNPLIG